ncbi:MAG: hypothetical protein ACR2NO_02880 [Chloroflexota bacterium]
MRGEVAAERDDWGRGYDRRAGRTVGQYEQVSPTHTRYFDCRRGVHMRNYYRDTGQVFDRRVGRTIGRYNGDTRSYWSARSARPTHRVERDGSAYDRQSPRSTRKIER